MGRALMLIVGCVLVGACHGESPTREHSSSSSSSSSLLSSEKRIALLRDQLVSIEEELPRLERWLEELRHTDRGNHQADIYLRRQTSRILWDPDVAWLDAPFETIVDFHRQLEALGVELLLLPILPVETVYPEMIGLSAPLETGESPPLIDLRLRELYLKLEQHGIEVLDLLPAFLERRFHHIDGPPSKPGPFRQLLFRQQDTHWTSYGASEAAEVVAKRIRHYPWFEEVARRFGQGVIVEDRRWRQTRGSIAELMVREGRLDPDTPLVDLLDHTAAIDGERWSVAERESPILVMGDSFVEPARTFPGHLTKELGFRTDLIHVPGGVPGNMEAVRLRGDRLAGKKLVVWEFVSFALNIERTWRPVDILQTP